MSPSLSLVLTSVLVYDLNQLYSRVRVLLHANSLLLMSKGSGPRAPADVDVVLHVLAMFGRHSFLTLNRERLYVLFKGLRVQS